MSDVLVRLKHRHNTSGIYIESCYIDTRENAEKNLAAIKDAYDSGKLDWRDEYHLGDFATVQFGGFEAFMRGVSIQTCTPKFSDEFRGLTGGSIGVNVISEILQQLSNEQDNPRLPSTVWTSSRVEQQARGTVEQRVLKIFCEQLGLSLEWISLTHNRDDLGMDSLDDIELVMAIEDEFEFEISDAEAERFTNVASVIEFVCSREHK